MKQCGMALPLDDFAATKHDSHGGKHVESVIRAATDVLVNGHCVVTRVGVGVRLQSFLDQSISQDGMLDAAKVAELVGNEGGEGLEAGLMRRQCSCSTSGREGGRSGVMRLGWLVDIGIDVELGAGELAKRWSELLLGVNVVVVLMELLSGTHVGGDCILEQGGAISGTSCAVGGMALHWTGVMGKEGWGGERKKGD